jgi:hypothetical protein
MEAINYKLLNPKEQPGVIIKARRKTVATDGSFTEFQEFEFLPFDLSWMTLDHFTRMVTRPGWAVVEVVNAEKLPRDRADNEIPDEAAKIIKFCSHVSDVRTSVEAELRASIRAQVEAEMRAAPLNDIATKAKQVKISELSK